MYIHLVARSTRTFTYRVSDADLRELERKARFRHLTKSALIRELVRQAPGPAEEEPSEGQPSDAEVKAALQVRGALSSLDYQGVKESIRRTGRGWVR
jgi:hypothetical protein